MRELLTVDAKNIFFDVVVFFSCNFKKLGLLLNRCRGIPTLLRDVVCLFLGQLG